MPSIDFPSPGSASDAIQYGILRPASSINNVPVNLPHAGPWLAWMLGPIFVILLVALVVGSLNHWEYDRAGYWMIQRDWFVALNTALAAMPEQVCSNMSELGSGEALILLLAPLLIWNPRSWTAMVVAAPVAAILSVSLKHLAAVPRPAAVLDQHLFTVIGETLAAHNSFPSGHSITIFTAAIAFMASKRLRPKQWQHWLSLLVVIGIALLICLSRVAVGAHWPLDLLAGGAVGSIAGLSGAMLVRHFPGSWNWSQSQRGRHVLGAVLLCGSLALIYVAQTTFYASVTLWVSVTCGILTALWLLASRPYVILVPEAATST